MIWWAGEQSESGCATQGPGLQFSGPVSGLKEDEKPKRIVEWWAGEWAEKEWQTQVYVVVRLASGLIEDK